MISMIGELIALILTTWDKGKSILENLIAVILNVHKADPNVLPGAFGNIVAETAAGASNLANGQVAEVFSYPASFNGVADIVDVYCVRRSAGELIIAPSAAIDAAIANRQAK